MAWSETEVDTPTFARELTELMGSHRSLWLADALPLGPVLVWAGGRSLAAALCAEPARTVVLLEPREAAAADGMQRGSPGLRVMHVQGGPSAIPDLAELGLGRFVGIVIVPSSASELDALLERLAPHGDTGCTICVVVPPGESKRAVRALESAGRRDAVTLHQSVTACSIIEPAESSRPSRLRGVSATGDPEVALVVSGLPAGASEVGDVLLGHDVGLAVWRTGVHQMAATVALLDQAVDERTTSWVHELERALADAEVRCADAQRSAEGWAAQVELLHRSTSWRVTAPLRRLTGLARFR